MKFNKTKKMIAATLVILLILTGCGQGAKTDGGKTKITYMNYSSSGAYEETLAKMIEAFEEENEDIEVEVLTYGFDDYFEQLQTRVAGNQAPDVFELNIENFNAYVSKDLVGEFSNVLPKNVNKKALEAFTVGTKQFGLPTKFSNVVMFYNKDLFDQAGVDYPSMDWTWEDEIEAGKKIRALGEQYYGTFRPTTTNEYYKILEQAGGTLMNDDLTKFNLNTDAAKKALKEMVSLVNDTNISPSKAQLGGISEADLFLSGRLGTLMTGIWFFKDFETNADFSWDITVEPGMDKKATHFFSDAIVYSSETENVEASMKLAEFISASPVAAKIRLDSGWDLPIVETDELKEEFLSYPVPENRQAVYDSLDYLVTPPSIERFSEFQDDFQLYIDKVLAGEMTVEEALEDAHVELNNKYFE